MITYMLSREREFLNVIVKPIFTATTLIVALTLASPQVLALTRYESQIEESKWSLSGDIFACTLAHPIPHFGQSEFIKEAGEPMKFVLHPNNEKIGPGKVYIISQAPSWIPGISPETLEVMPYPGYGLTVEVGGKVAEQMLSSLDRGRHPVVAGTAWENGRENVEVALSNINFNPAYDEFRRCMGSLLPVNFEQVARTAALFPTNGTELTDRIKKRLDLVAIYVEADPTIEYIYIDGHTDVIGSRRDNRELSKERAEKVTEYLLQKGIAPEKIVSRYHGERYPAADNRTGTGRERNRRVTIRLERMDNNAQSLSEPSP